MTSSAHIAAMQFPGGYFVGSENFVSFLLLSSFSGESVMDFSYIGMASSFLSAFASAFA
jgi:hypothetical protein